MFVIFRMYFPFSGAFKVKAPSRSLTAPATYEESAALSNCTVAWMTGSCSSLSISKPVMDRSCGVAAACA